jgi:hypothetical protein
LFPKTTSYLSSESPHKRNAHDEGRAEMSLRDEQSFQSWMDDDSIGSFDDLCNKIDVFMQDYEVYNVVKTKECVCLYIVDVKNVPLAHLYRFSKILVLLFAKRV